MSALIGRRPLTYRSLALSAALALAAPVAAAPPPELIGLWTATFVQMGPKVLNGKQRAGFILVVGPDGYIVGPSNGALDAVPGKPGALVVTQRTGPDAGKSFPALYSLKGRTLTIAGGFGGSAPTSLRPTGEPGNMVFRFKR